MRCRAWGCQPLKEPTTATERALGAQTVKTVPSGRWCAPITSNWRWWWLGTCSPAWTGSVGGVEAPLRVWLGVMLDEWMTHSWPRPAQAVQEVVAGFSRFRPTAMPHARLPTIVLSTILMPNHG